MSRPTQTPRENLAEGGVTVVAFSPDKTQIAYSPNTHLIHIATIGTTNCATWNTTFVLKGHEQSVSGIDWSPATNQICSCAHDRTAFVWQYDETAKQWIQILIMVDATIKRGLTSIKWSPSGKKIYIGSASANLGVARLGPEGFWVCGVTEPHASSITCLAAHPVLDTIVATGATDGFVKAISTYSRSADGASSSVTAKVGTELYGVKIGVAWVNAVAWSPSGRALCVATHDSRITFCEGPSVDSFDSWVSRTISLPLLPFRAVAFFQEDSLVAAGYDYYPVVFRNSGGAWSLKQKGIIVNDGSAAKQVTAAEAARRRFQDAASMGQQTTAAESTVETRHKNTVVALVPFRDEATPFQFATASLDGRVELWSQDALTSA